MDVDAPIFRFHQKRYLEPLLSGKLVLRTTSGWADPWENPISLCGYEYVDGRGGICQSFLDKGRFPTFAQCWTKLSESDALWRIYSMPGHRGPANLSFADDEAVRLTTTAGKLIEALRKGTNQVHNCYIGQMLYLSEDELLDRIGSTIAASRYRAFSGIDGHIESLLLKRLAFAHEQESRLLYIDSHRAFEHQQQIEIPVDTNNLVTEITLDPRVHVGSQEEQQRVEWLRSQGFRNQIATSLLYQGILFMKRI